MDLGRGTLNLHRQRLLQRRWQPLHLFQEAIPKRLELRITVIGQWGFAAAIFSHHAERTRADWRRSSSDLRYGVHALPAEIEAALMRLMYRLQLHYGAIDMIVQPDGRSVFLEVNPCGKFFWIEQETGLPLADTLAAFLIEGDECCFSLPQQ